MYVRRSACGVTFGSRADPLALDHLLCSPGSLRRDQIHTVGPLSSIALPSSGASGSLGSRYRHLVVLTGPD